MLVVNLELEMIYFFFYFPFFFFYSLFLIPGFHSALTLSHLHGFWLVNIATQHFPDSLPLVQKRYGGVRGLDDCMRCYLTATATNLTTLFWSSGNLCSAYIEQWESATAIQGVFFAWIIQIVGFSWQLLFQCSLLFVSKLKRSKSSVRLKCSMTSILASNILLR